MPKNGRGECVMLSLHWLSSRKLSKEVIVENLKDIEDDTLGQVRYLGIYWTLGRYDTVVLFEAPNEKVAMNMALKRADRMDIELSWPYRRKKVVRLDRPSMIVEIPIVDGAAIQACFPLHS